MTTRPELAREGNWAAGLAAVALFAVLAAAFLTASYPAPMAFSEGASVVASIGYAMFDLESPIPSEGFLVSFIVIAIVLDAALDGSIMLATRDDDESEAVTDGGHAPGQDRAPGTSGGED